MAPRTKKTPIESVKGMHDILGEDFYLYQGFFEKAQEVAIYYGFEPIDTPVFEKAELFERGVGGGTDIVEKEMYTLKTKGGDMLAARPEQTAPLVRAYIEHGMQSKPQPVLLYTYGSYFRHERPQKGRLRQFRQFDLEILGSTRSVADAMIINTTAVILEEAGFKHLCIHINSIGDKECRPAYIRKLTTYYKKHVKELCANCKRRLKKNPLRLLDCKHDNCKEIKAAAPTSVGFLCANCKKHFKEVLEHLDMLEIPYLLDHTLVRGLDYYTRTVFEIKEKGEDDFDNPEKGLALAGGGRYDYLGKLLGSKKDIPGIGVGIGVDRIIQSEESKKLCPRIIKKPKIHFIQLGFDAKLKSFEIIEILRKAHVPLSQSLAKNSLSTQLKVAEELSVPHVIIFGQKEAMDATVIVRNMKTHSQDTVAIDTLAGYLKNLK